MMTENVVVQVFNFIGSKVGRKAKSLFSLCHLWLRKVIFNHCHIDKGSRNQILMQ